MEFNARSVTWAIFGLGLYCSTTARSVEPASRLRAACFMNLRKGWRTLREYEKNLPESFSTLPEYKKTFPESSTTLPECKQTLSESSATLREGFSTLPEGWPGLREGDCTLPEGFFTSSEGSGSLSMRLYCLVEVSRVETGRLAVVGVASSRELLSLYVRQYALRLGRTTRRSGATGNRRCFQAGSGLRNSLAA